MEQLPFLASTVHTTFVKSNNMKRGSSRCPHSRIINGGKAIKETAKSSEARSFLTGNSGRRNNTTPLSTTYSSSPTSKVPLPFSPAITRHLSCLTSISADQSKDVRK